MSDASSGVKGHGLAVDEAVSAGARRVQSDGLGVVEASNAERACLTWGEVGAGPLRGCVGVRVSRYSPRWGDVNGSGELLVVSVTLSLGSPSAAGRPLCAARSVLGSRGADRRRPSASVGRTAVGLGIGMDPTKGRGECGRQDGSGVTVGTLPPKPNGACDRRPAAWRRPASLRSARSRSWR